MFIIMSPNSFLSFFLSPRTLGFCFQTTPKVVARGSHRVKCNQSLVLSLPTCGQHPTLWFIPLPWSSKPNAHVAFLPSLWLIPLRILCWFLLVSQPLHEGVPQNSVLDDLIPIYASLNFLNVNILHNTVHLSKLRDENYK